MCLRLARQFVHGKIRNHRTLLMRNHLEPPATALLKLKQAANEALRARTQDELLGIEGGAASVYFQEFSGMLRVADKFSQAWNREATHKGNCVLAALAVGFDPYVGFYHQPRFGRPALALDIMEEFRPLIAESTVLRCINNWIITEKDFVQAGQAVNLSAAARKRFFRCMNGGSTRC